MTAPATETLEREKDKLYLTDAELIRRLGVPAKVMRSPENIFTPSKSLYSLSRNITDLATGVVGARRESRQISRNDASGVWLQP